MLDQVSLNILSKTKLNDKQSRVYLAALQLGKASVAQIAEVAQLKRTITYVTIEELLVRGYLTQVPGDKRKIYMATDPNAIATELDQVAQDFKEMLPYLRSLQRKAGKPYVRYYHGLDSVKRGIRQIRRPNEARYMSSIARVMRYIPDEVERWKKTYMAGKGSPGGRHMLTDTPLDREYGQIIAQAQQLVRYLALEDELDMEMALIDGVVYLTSFDADIDMTVIESESLYRSLCALYDVAWAASKK